MHKMRVKHLLKLFEKHEIDQFTINCFSGKIENIYDKRYQNKEVCYIDSVNNLVIIKTRKIWKKPL